MSTNYRSKAMTKSIGNRRLREDRRFAYAILSLCVIGGTATLFAFDGFFGFWDDEPYQALCVRRYREAPLGVLTFFIGKLWTDIFGFSLLNLRYLTSILVALATGVSATYLYRLTRRPVLAGLCFLLGAILMKLTSFYLYNWDTGTYLFDSIALCVLISLLSRPTTVKFLIFGVTIALITLGRAPSAILLPLSMLLIVCGLRHGTRFYSPVKACLMVIAGWTVVMLLLTALILGSPAEYIRQYELGNVVSGHSLSYWSYIKIRIFYIFDKTVSGWFVASGCMLMAVVLPWMRRRGAAAALLLLWLLTALFYEYLQAKSVLSFPLTLGGDTPVGIGLLLAAPIYCLYDQKRMPRALLFNILAVVIIYVSMAFGSDAFVERMTVGFTVPVIIAIVWRSDICVIRRYVKCALGVCLVVFGSIFIFMLFYFARFYDRFGKTVTLSPYEGITVSWKELSDDEKLATAERMVEAITTLKRQNARIAVIGDQIVAQIVYDYEDALSFHEFHLGLDGPEGWEKYKGEMMRNADAFVIPLDLKNFDYGQYRNELRKGGFSDERQIGKSLVFYRDGYAGEQGER